ncbi:SUKH-3 immunity protein [Lentzea xinjiangensis]|uniref:SUKH-3 immunity protein n=2 Tax=Lentzea xinjiangensis TaxID=402600 RepID=A0A1H9UD90_9PSEU|nr:SUKH-3 immunity protein [Lentzea xinjiangensis]
MPPAADEFLSRFGGLSFEWREIGVYTHRVDVDLNPELCVGQEDGFIEWSQELGKAMFPLGEIDRGRHMLAIDEDGMLYDLIDGIAVYGPGVEGLNALLSGVLPERLPFE